MGLFSFKCRGCGESIKAFHAQFMRLPNYMMWQSKAVCLEADGNITIGTYDGYGKITGRANDIEGGDWWHHRCWDAEYQPGFKEPSEPAEDQGYFFEDKTRVLTEQLESIAVSEKKCTFCGVNPVATELRCVDVCVACVQTALHMNIGVLELDLERMKEVA